MSINATAALGRAGHAEAARPNKWLVAVSVLAGAMMGAIDSSVVNVALAHIQATYGVTTQEVTWVSTSYLIALVIIMPLTAWLGSILGRKRMYMLAVAIFTAASMLCGLARTLGQLIAFRVIQGIGGGVLAPTAQAIMRESFPPEEQGQAMGVFGMIILLGPAIGPTLGGWLTDNYSWPWIFFVNLPIGILGLFLASLFIVDPPYMRAQGWRRIDGVGIGLMAVGLASLQVVLEQGETDGWFDSAFIVTLAAVVVLALIAFVIWELRVDEPAVDLRVFRNVSFASGAVIGGVVGMTLFGGLILLPLFLQNLLGYDATQAGLTLMPRSLVMVLMMPVAGLLYNRLGVYVMLPCGLVLAGISGQMMAHFTTDSGHLQLLAPLILQGIGFALMFVPMSTTALSTIPRRKMQSASSLFTLMFQLGGSLGTAIVIAMVDHKITTASANLVRYASVYNPLFMQWWQTFQAAFVVRGHDPTTAHMQALATLYALINQQASVVAFDYAFGAIGVMFFLCLPLVLLLRRGRAEVDDVPVA
ncbi:MAG TPA: DHA2 family efflux MFS transporter permease subunit [bacterium]|nr:DHA2 family efflux MFS transporter permease subunit [bacterium]